MHPMLRMIKTKNKKQKRHTSNRNKHIAIQVAIITAVLSPHTLWAKGAVTQINTHTESVDSLTYNANSESYTWQGNNLIIDSFDYNGKTYNYEFEADNVTIRRVDNSITSDERCSLFVEGQAASSTTFVPGYPRLASTNNCDMTAVMGGNVINRGTLDVFNNGGNGRIFSATNIERVDIIFSGGVTAPYDSAKLSSSGVVATEKSGNNDALIAAVLSIDSNGSPTSYSKPVLIGNSSYALNATHYGYGITNISYPMEFINNETSAPQGYLYKEAGNFPPESMGMAFIDLEAFELTAGQIWYGFSYFSPDVGDGSTPNALGQINWKSGIDPVNYAGFPLDTDHSPAYGDADLYGGIGGYFVDSELNNISGSAFKDDNANTTMEAGESGIANIKVTLYKDNNNDGSIQASDTEYPSINTDKSGKYSFVGVSNGNYLIVIDKADTDTPSNYQLGSNEIIPITINNADSTENNFSYLKSGLSINKTITPATATVGENIVYTITVSNDSNIDATGVSIIDKLSDAVTYVSDDSNGDYSPISGIWSIGNINKNTNKILTITVNVN